MVYGLTMQHDRMVELESEPQVGTTVRLVFPALEAQALDRAKPLMKSA